MEQELRFDASSGLGDRRLTLLLFRNVGNAAAILDAVLGRAEAAAVPEQPMAVINANLVGTGLPKTRRQTSHPPPRRGRAPEGS